MTRLYNWSKEQAAKPQGKESVMAQLWQARQAAPQPATQYGKVKALKESAALFSFLQQNGISTMQELHEKIAVMNGSYYDLRGEIVTAERRIAALTERLEVWAQYEKSKGKRRGEAEETLYRTAGQFLVDLKATGEAITPKLWRAEATTLTTKKDELYRQMRAMREEIKVVEQLRKAAQQLTKTEPRKEPEHDR